MPIHTKSISILINTGVTIGTIMNTISIKSIKNPAIKTIIMTKIKNPFGPKLDLEIMSKKSWSP